MTKPPTFTECTICGREFGSKSIVIHERQCLQKLRKTEIMQQEAEQQNANRRNKKKSGAVTAKPDSNNSQKSVIVTSVSPELLNLPKIPTKNHGSTSSKVPGNTPKEKSKTIRPTTATLARPQILNPEYIQYDMSLTRIDYTMLQRQKPQPVKKATDENHNSNHNNRSPQRQSQFDDMNSRSSNVVLPAVTGISASSLKGKHQYQHKGIDPEYRITKLPESALTTFLGEPAKKYGYGGGSADDAAILPRHTESVQNPINVPVTANVTAKANPCYNPSPLPTLLCDPLKKADHCPCTSTDEKYNLPKLENVRASDEPINHQEPHIHFVTPGVGALSNLPSSTGYQQDVDLRGTYGIEDEDEEEEFGEYEDEESEFFGERHISTSYTYSNTTLPSDINEHPQQEVSGFYDHEQQQGTSWGNLKSDSEMVQETKYSSPKSSLEFVHPANSETSQDITVLKEGEPLEIIPVSSTESGVTLKPRPGVWGRRKSRILSEPLPELNVWTKLVSVESGSLADSDYEQSASLDSYDQYETANSGDAEDENSSENYFVREPVKPDFVEDSTDKSTSTASTTCDEESYESEDKYKPQIIRYHSAPNLLLTKEFHQKIQKNLEFGIFMQTTNPADQDAPERNDLNSKGYNWMSGDDGVSSDDGHEELLIKPSVNGIITLPSTTSPVYSNIPDPIPQISTEESHETNVRISKSAESTTGSKVLKSILKKSGSSLTIAAEKVDSDDSLSLGVPTAHQPKSKASSFTGSDSDDEGSCNKSFTELFSASRTSLSKKRSRPLTRHSRSATRFDQLESQPLQGQEPQSMADQVPEMTIEPECEEFGEENEMTFDELVTELAELLQADKSQLELPPNVEMCTDSAVIQELTHLLRDELRKHRRRTRRTNLTLARERHQQFSQLQKVRDWLETCDKIQLDDRAEKWDDSGSPSLESLTKSSTSPEFDSIVEEFTEQYADRVPSSICQPEISPSNTTNKIVSGLLSAVFHVKEMHRSRLYKFTDEVHFGDNETPTQVPSQPKVDQNNQLENEPEDIGQNLEIVPPRTVLQNRSIMPLPRPGALKTPAVIARINSPKHTGKKSLGDRTLKSEPNSPCKTTVASSSPVKQTAKTIVPKSPTKLKPPIVHSPPVKSKVQPRSVLPQKKNRVRPATPQIGHKFGCVNLNSKPTLTPLAQLKQTLKNPLQTRTKSCQIPERRSAYCQYSPPLEKNKSPPASGKVSSPNKTELPGSLVTKSPRSVRFMDSSANNAVVSKSPDKGTRPSIEMSSAAHPTHLVYQFHPQQNRAISAKSNVKSSSNGGEQKPPTFPSKYTLMMPKSQTDRKCVNLNIIIRRRGSDGTLPLVKKVVAEYSQEWMYLIVDEERSNSNTPKRAHPLAKPLIVLPSKPKTQKVDEKEAKCSRDTKSRCNCGLEFNCHEIYNSSERQKYVLGRYSPKYTVTIQLCTQFPRNEGAMQKYKLMSCPLCEKAFHPDRKTEITGHLEICLRKFLVQLPREIQNSLTCSSIRTYRLACI